MFSRVILIIVVFAVAIYRAAQGAWVPTAGLLAMGAGLVILKIAERKPALRLYAYGCFVATAAIITYMLLSGVR